MTPLPPFCGDDRHSVAPDDARVVVLPVPYEGTVSYGTGAAEGPRAILEASAQLEKYDEELDTRIDLAGIHTLPPVDVADAEPAQVVERIHRAALEPLRTGRLLATLGGEHSVTCGVLAALREVARGPVAVLQIDAHADLRQSYQGTPYSHACVMARVHELGLPFVQVGIRSLSAPERAFLRERDLERNVLWAHRMAGQPAEAWIGHALERLAAFGARDLYVTIDVDGLDPAIMSATGTPEPGGLGWYDTLHLLRRAAATHRVVGFDVTELAPRPGNHAPDFLAARLTYKMMGYALAGETEGGRAIGFPGAPIVGG